MATTTIPAHLVRRFRELGCDEGFGIVGDFALRLFGRLHDLGFPVHVAADEQGAAFAADAFARLRGFGVVAITYGVGGLKVVNTTAGAWAEQVPLLVLSGAPGMAERRGDPLLHHKVKTFQTQLDVFRDLTVAEAALEDPAVAAREIDRVLVACLREQRPGYLEVPRDMIDVEIVAPEGPLALERPPVEEPALAAGVAEAMQRIRGARSIVLAAGLLAVRRRLAAEFRELAELLDAPVVTDALTKGFFPERHPLSHGVYMGAVSRPEVRTLVESADLLLGFGVLYSDLTSGAFTTALDVSRIVHATDRELLVGWSSYPQVPLWRFLPALLEALRKERTPRSSPRPFRVPAMRPKGRTPLTVEGVMGLVEAALDERHGLIFEPGECLFASVDLAAPAWTMTSGYYATMGFATPAAVGAGKADPARRPVVLAGDGAFLMTGLEAAIAAFHRVNPIIVIVDNHGYGTQRPMLDGPFNDIPSLRSERLPEVFGAGKGFLCEDEESLARALAAATALDELVIIRAVVPKGRPSPALERLAAALGKGV